MNTGCDPERPVALPRSGSGAARFPVGPLRSMSTEGAVHRQPDRPDGSAGAGASAVWSPVRIRQFPRWLQTKGCRRDGGPLLRRTASPGRCASRRRRPGSLAQAGESDAPKKL